MRIERSISSMLIVGASVFAIYQWRKAAFFEWDNEQLRDQLQILQVEVETARRMAEANEENSKKLKQQTTELMRLRNEVTQFRGSGTSVETLTAENQKLKAQLAATRTEAATDGSARERDHYPRESWTFAGYASPEEAMISAIWAMKEGDRARYLESLTPEEQERMTIAWAANDGGAAVEEKHRNLTSTINGLKILERQNLSPNEIVMNVFLEGQGRLEKVRMNQIGQEWKFGGFLREQQSAPP